MVSKFHFRVSLVVSTAGTPSGPEGRGRSYLAVHSVDSLVSLDEVSGARRQPRVSAVNETSGGSPRSSPVPSGLNG